MKFLVALAPLLGLALAAPTPSELAPRCGTTYLPTILQTLVEDTPTVVSPNPTGFKVARTVGPDGRFSQRTYQLVAFTGIAAGSYACQLNVNFPNALTISPAGRAVQLNVTTILNGRPAEIVSPNTFSWSSIAALNPGQYLFGTVNAVPGSHAIVNSAVCATNLAFVFEVAVWETYTASVEFTQGVGLPPSGVFLTANC